MTKRKKQIRLECHGGPMDGDWESLQEGDTHIDVKVGPHQGRVGRYSVQGFKPRGVSDKYQQILRWEGEL